MVVRTKKTPAKSGSAKKMPAKKTRATKPPTKKLGLESSATRIALLETTERLIRERGFAAITSRVIAAEAGLKPQLIHYYFNSVDDLYVAVFRRGAEADHARRVHSVDAAEQPLRALWAQSSDPKSNRFVTEFMALANHNSAVRAEITVYAEKQRAYQVDVISRHLAACGAKSRIPPLVVAVLLETVARGIALESGLNITLGHEAMSAFVETCLQWFENTAAPVPAPRSGDAIADKPAKQLPKRSARR